MDSQTILLRLENELQTESIRKRVSEDIDKIRIGEICNEVFSKIKPAITKLYGRETPDIAIGCLSIWDLAAFVAADENKKSFAVGISNGAVRLFDVTNCCRWGFGSTEYPESLKYNSERLNKMWGAIVYQYATHRYHDLRHWMLDPTIGSVIPYGIVDLSMGTLVHPSLRTRQETALWYIIAFIVAHEIAHIMAGHFSDTVSSRVTCLTDTAAKISTLNIDKKHEFEADLLAIRTLIMDEEENRNEIIRQVSFFFNTLSTIELISFDPIFWGHSHPSPDERMENVIENIEHLTISPLSSAEGEIIHKAAQAFSYIPVQLGEGILRDPTYFRAEAFKFEDYQDFGGTIERLKQSVMLSNQGQNLLIQGKLADARTCFETALHYIKDCLYGEGYRIIYANLAQVNLEMGCLTESVKWTVEGVRESFAHNDRPAALYLLQSFKDVFELYKKPKGIKRLARWLALRSNTALKGADLELTADNIALLNSIKQKGDPRLSALVDSILRLNIQ